jgi:hypothetical protein
MSVEEHPMADPSLPTVGAVRVGSQGGEVSGTARSPADDTAKRVADPATSRLSWLNWRAAGDGLPVRSAAEFALYSDTHFIDQIQADLGPYQFLNVLPLRSGDPATWQSELALVLRANDHLADPSEPMTQTWLVNSTIDDDLGALMSLALRTRVHPGGVTRVFGTDGSDEKGMPGEWFHRRPYLPMPSPGAPLQLPALKRTVDLKEALGLLPIFARLGPETSSALVRAARLYRDGIWIADGDPNEAWIKLVSAVETAAAAWAADGSTPSERLTESMPDLVQTLLAAGGNDLVEAVAPGLAPLVGSTRRFRDFGMAFAPEPPSIRPPGFMQFDWNDMRKGLGVVYKWRSRALHDGIPFPWVSSTPPRVELDGSIQETAFGEGVYEQGRLIDRKELPMLLNTFEHIASGALRGWWASLGATPWEGETPRVNAPHLHNRGVISVRME